ncbi:hypothetical protein [Microbulbifer sp. THAF38]|uniref:hypothetical protein n=1 Tax=Microbulbifer sp. THAF38 TaxID=2587856 RepID=UPI001267C03F|nr:hypothetical protein [Microbulbifer sp. THAF38]QFT55808.1 hypothetical protein FIU95_14755 [Microbulbifer sp. THAF38]
MPLTINRAPSAQNLVSKNTLAVAGFYGAGGPNAGDNQSLNAWVSHMGGAMFSPLAKRQARQYLIQGASQGKFLVLVGYSRGGTSAIKLANVLGRLGISLSHLVIFDAHSVFDNKTFKLRYNNIGQAHNFFQRNPRSAGQYGWWGINPYWGCPLQSNYIEVQQIDFTGDYFKTGILVSHLNIVRQSLAALPSASVQEHLAQPITT